MAMITTSIVQKPAPPVTKGKTIPQIVEDLKREAANWGGETTSEKEYMVGGKLKEITLVIKFKLH